MKYVFFIAAFNAFFFLVLLLEKKPKALHDRILTYWLLYLGIATGSYAFSLDFFPDAPFLSSAIIALFLLQGPFLYLYVSALTLKEKHFKKGYIVHFIPFVAFILYLLIASGFPEYSKGIRLDHTSGSLAQPPLLFLFFLIITALSGPVYFFLSYGKYQENKKVASEFSTQKINLDWLGKLIPIFGLVWTVLIIIAIIHHVFHLFSMAFCTNGLFLSLSGLIILIGYFGLRQRQVFINYPTETELEPKKGNEVEDIIKTKYGSSKLEGRELQESCNLVGQYMKTKKPYLDPNLTLPKLAKDLKISTHHLSQVINEIHGNNFFDFINIYRVEEVKTKIIDPKFHKYSILGIAMECGFNSKSAFNRAFKKFTGTTPSKFRSSQSSD